MRFLLDANAVIALLNDADAKFARRVRREKLADVGVSAIVIHELYYGAFKSGRTAQNVGIVDEMQFAVLPYEKEDARCAGRVRAHVAAKGTPIGPYDVLIAGQAVARNLILVTRNRKEFARVPDLSVEDWQE